MRAAELDADFVLPVPSEAARVISPYVRDSGANHAAIDYGNRAESPILGDSYPVFAIADGLVTEADFSLEIGNWVTIEHEDRRGQRFRSRYFHLRGGLFNDLRNMAPARQFAQSLRCAQADLDCLERANKALEMYFLVARAWEIWLDLEARGYSLVPDLGGPSGLKRIMVTRDDVQKFWGREEHLLQVERGDRVTRGQLLGWAGQTGYRGGRHGNVQLDQYGDGTHLHFATSLLWTVRSIDGFDVEPDPENLRQQERVQRWVFMDSFGLYGQQRDGYEDEDVHQFHVNHDPSNQHQSIFGASTHSPWVYGSCESGQAFGTARLGTAVNPLRSEMYFEHSPIREPLSAVRAADGGSDTWLAYAGVSRDKMNGLAAADFWFRRPDGALRQELLTIDNLAPLTDITRAGNRWILAYVTGRPGEQSLWTMEREIGSNRWEPALEVRANPRTLVEGTAESDLNQTIVRFISLSYDPTSDHIVLCWLTNEARRVLNLPQPEYRIAMATRRVGQDQWTLVPNRDVPPPPGVIGIPRINTFGFGSNTVDVAFSSGLLRNGALVFDKQDGSIDLLRFRIGQDGLPVRGRGGFSNSTTTIGPQDGATLGGESDGRRGATLAANPIIGGPQFVLARTTSAGRIRSSLISVIEGAPADVVNLEAGSSVTPPNGRLFSVPSLNTHVPGPGLGPALVELVVVS